MSQSPPGGRRATDVSSLSRLLESELFTLQMCISYIARHKHDAACLDALFSCLATRFDLEDVEEYIPQLGTILLLPKTEVSGDSVDRFMLKACARRMQFALKAIWYVESQSADRANSPILEKMETDAINRHAFKRKHADVDPTTLSIEQHLLNVEEEVLAKERLCHYYYNTKYFIARLTDLSAQVLRKLPRADRAARLSDELDQINAQLPAINVSLPFDTTYKRIVRVPTVPNRFRVLNSRERAPYLVLFEYIRDGKPHEPPPLTPATPPPATEPAVRGPTSIVEEHFRQDSFEQRAQSAGVKPASFSPATAPSVVNMRAVVEGGGFRSVLPVGGYGVCGWESPPPMPAVGSQCSSPRKTPPPGEVMGRGGGAANLINPSYFSTSPSNVQNASLCDAPDLTRASKARTHGVPRTASGQAPVRISPRAKHTRPPFPTTPSPQRQASVDQGDDDPDAADRERRMNQLFGQPWAATVEQARASSPYSGLRGWGLMPIIVKGGDDMRQEVLAMQLIAAFDRVWKAAGLPLKLFVYGVVTTSFDSGFIELVPDSASIDSLKKALPEDSARTLLDYWHHAYGEPTSIAYRNAQRNFVESMAAYSVVSYILQLKDRHNANILVRRDGCVVHIDFGYMLSISPGGVNFESMPFKLSQESIDVMGGINSEMFQYFRVLVYAAFKEAAKYSDQIISLAEITAEGPPLPCFGNDPKSSLEALRSRFLPWSTDADLAVWTKDAIDQSIDNWRARGYDRFQKWSNGIL